jgi:hypothetical protein
MNRFIAQIVRKGASLVLIMIILLSIFSMSPVFSDRGSATTPAEVDTIPDPVYPGQKFNTSIDSSFPDNDVVFLVEIERDGGDINSFSGPGPFQSPVTLQNNGNNRYEVDTTDFDPGSDYAIANTTSYRGESTNITQEFTVFDERFSAEFEDDIVDQSSDESIVQLGSDRDTSEYNLTVSVEGPDEVDAEMIEALFNAANGTGATVTDPDNLPMDRLNYDREEGDTVDDLREDGYVTLNLKNLEEVTGTLNDGELEMNVTRLAQQEEMLDPGEYTFRFQVADTGATSEDTITFGEPDAEFSDGIYRSTAGDIATFEFELEGSNSAWIQIGGADSGFVDVVYVEAENVGESVELKVNTRLLGTTTDLRGEQVYDFENVETFESAYHDANGGDMSNTPASMSLFEDDGNNPADDLDSYVSYLGIADRADEQLVRPLQPSTYSLQIAGTDIEENNGDIALFDAEIRNGEANDQLDRAVVELSEPTVGEVIVHTAPEGSANSINDIDELLAETTVRDEVATGDRLVVQVEATGLYGALVAGAQNGDAADISFDRLDEGFSTRVLHNVVETTDESIEFEIMAGETTGNQDPIEVDLEALSTSDSYILMDNERGQFFVVVDTGSDNAFKNGDSPTQETPFTARLEYDANNEDERFRFASDSNPDPFAAATNSVNYPYYSEGTTATAQTEFELAPREISTENQNRDGDIQVEAVSEAEITGRTNIAPGSVMDVSIESTSSTPEFFMSEPVTIDDEGSFSATFDLRNYDVGAEFDTIYWTGDTRLKTTPGILVEEGEVTSFNQSEIDIDRIETSEGDEQSNEDAQTPNDEVNESGQQKEQEEINEESPGFGILLTLLGVGCLILLAKRQSNSVSGKKRMDQ